MDSYKGERNLTGAEGPGPPAQPWLRSGSWVVGARPRAGIQLRLFCFPYAGGAASAFRGWIEGLPPQIEVCPIQLPGRASRFREEPFQSVVDLIRAVADGLRPLLDRPFALFGHSMGALVAFELARELRRRAEAGPVLLAVSGHQAPDRPDPEPPVGHLPDAEFLAEVRRRYDGIPPEVLAEEELLQLMMPILRADIRVLETYAYAPEPPLDCTISCFGGEDDRHVSLADLEAWREQTRASLRLRLFPGRHFFIESSRAAVLQALREDLEPWLSSGEGGA